MSGSCVGPLSALRAVADPDNRQAASDNLIRVRGRRGPYSGPAITARALRALTALAAGATDAEAARLASVSAKTIVKWRREPEFARELQGLLEIQRERIEGILATLSGECEQVLRDALNATDTETKSPAHAIRLRAAEGILGSYARIARRTEETQTQPTGPLIVLPPGTQRMALALDDGGDGRAQQPVGPPSAPDGLHVQSLALPTAPPDARPIDVIDAELSEPTEPTEAAAATPAASSQRSQPPAQPLSQSQPSQPSPPSQPQPNEK